MYAHSGRASITASSWATASSGTPCRPQLLGAHGLDLHRQRHVMPRRQPERAAPLQVQPRRAPRRRGGGTATETACRAEAGVSCACSGVAASSADPLRLEEEGSHSIMSSGCSGGSRQEARPVVPLTAEEREGSVASVGLDPIGPRAPCCDRIGTRRRRTRPESRLRHASRQPALGAAAVPSARGRRSSSRPSRRCARRKSCTMIHW